MENSANQAAIQIKPVGPPPKEGNVPANNDATAAKPEVNPLDLPENKNNQNNGRDASNLIKSIVSTETGESNVDILQEAPEVDQNLLKELTPPKSILLVLLKVFFGLLVLGSIASYLFFTSQLTDKLDFANRYVDYQNVSQDLAASNAEVKSLQTEINFYRYLQIKALIDQFSYHGDSYIKNYEIATSQTASKKEQEDAIDTLTFDRGFLIQSIVTARDKLLDPFTATLVSMEAKTEAELKALFEVALTTKLSQKASELLLNLDIKAQYAAMNYIHTTYLVGNNHLLNLLVATDFDNLSDKELYDFLKVANSVIVNDFSIIQKIKDQRIKWSDIMNEIDLRTIAVDAYYSESHYDEIGGIRYTSYDFDSSGPRITVTGETKRFDTTNFTMIVNLIEEFNRSPLFENGEMRSFTKSGSQDDGYLSTLKISLHLEEETLELSEETDTEEDSTLLDELSS